MLFRILTKHQNIVSREFLMYSVVCVGTPLVQESVLQIIGFLKDPISAETECPEPSEYTILNGVPQDVAHILVRVRYVIIL